jgi:hypothetical protein
VSAHQSLLFDEDVRLLAKKNEERSRSSKRAMRVVNAKIMSHEGIMEVEKKCHKNLGYSIQA